MTEIERLLGSIDPLVQHYGLIIVPLVITVESLGPKMGARRGFDELCGNPHASRCLPNTPFKHKAYAELTADLLDVNGSSLIRKTRIAGDHKQPSRFGKSRSDVLGDAIREMLLVRVTAHVLKSQYRY